MNKYYIALLAGLISTSIYAQKNYFVDGFHGGIYGHYPVEWKTQFIVDQLSNHPEWKICLEIEPETWDTVMVQTPEAYRELKKVSASERVEFTNPTYAQPYCYNISGESIIRQFQYGIKKIKTHFPEVEMVTYSVEEPCFTSCLPQILKLFGFKYAVLKCPNTCWGGYTNAYGGELVNWIGTDGTSILTVPRYACEALEENSTWQTTAWCNSESYLQACRNAGIQHPAGMCFQDAGWKNGPWLGSGTSIKNNSVYVTWKDYIENKSIGRTNDNWHFTQEDMHVNLMWGSQVLQRIAQEVRTSENKIVMAEKMSLIAYLENGYRYSQKELDNGWRTLMLAQHHDSWIVPCNKLNKERTWAEEITLWTNNTNRVADKIAQEAMSSFESQHKTEKQSTGYVRICNTLGVLRKELVHLNLPREYATSDIKLYDCQKREVACFVDKGGENISLFFEAEVPPFGYSTYRIQKGKTRNPKSIVSKSKTDKEYVIENDLYKIVFDLSKGGTIKSLIAKKEGGKDFAHQKGAFALGELRGYFYEAGRFYSSIENPARVSEVEENPFQTKVKIEGSIASHPYTQVITLVRGQKRIDFDLTVHWKNNVGIGEYKETDWVSNRRAYCDDRFKLSVLFPVDLQNPRIYKDAPFDVCESKLEDTFFNTWDHIKHNIILHWVDLVEQDHGHALTLLSDHTTSYSYGRGLPLGLTAQYSGGGLWGVDYKITAPLRLKYALIPHQGKWDEAATATYSNRWNESLLCSYATSMPLLKRSLIDLSTSGYQISTAYAREDGKILIRLFNAEGDASLQKITFGMSLASVEEVDLNGDILTQRKILKHSGKTELEIAMPRFGIKTFLLKAI